MTQQISAGVSLTRRAFDRLIASALALIGLNAGTAVAQPAPAVELDIWRCGNGDCPGYEYDPSIGEEEYNIPPGIPFEALPEDFVCPRCGAGKAEFRKLPRKK